MLKFWKDESGQDLIEYALMAGFVVVAAVAIIPMVAGLVTGMFNKISASLNLATASETLGITSVGTTRMLGVVLAVICLGIIVIRRKGFEDYE
jgi:pilus assembly protein Flp/PilA